MTSVRAVNASNMPLIAEKKSDTSASALTPVASSNFRKRNPTVRFIGPFAAPPALGKIRHEEPADDLAIEEVGNALRRLEEIERALRRRRRGRSGRTHRFRRGAYSCSIAMYSCEPAKFCERSGRTDSSESAHAPRRTARGARPGDPRRSSGRASSRRDCRAPRAPCVRGARDRRSWAHPRARRCRASWRGDVPDRSSTRRRGGLRAPPRARSSPRSSSCRRRRSPTQTTTRWSRTSPVSISAPRLLRAELARGVGHRAWSSSSPNSWRRRTARGPSARAPRRAVGAR